MAFEEPDGGRCAERVPPPIPDGAGLSRYPSPASWPRVCSKERLGGTGAKLILTEPKRLTEPTKIDNSPFCAETTLRTNREGVPLQKKLSPVSLPLSPASSSKALTPFLFLLRPGFPQREKAQGGAGQGPVLQLEGCGSAKEKWTLPRLATSPARDGDARPPEVGTICADLGEPTPPIYIPPQRSRIYIPHGAALTEGGFYASPAGASKGATGDKITAAPCQRKTSAQPPAHVTDGFRQASKGKASPRSKTWAAGTPAVHPTVSCSRAPAPPDARHNGNVHPGIG